MAESAEVVIVGAGFAGAATAYHLAADGVTDVVVLDAERQPGFHASGRNAALIFQLLKNPEEARLVVESIRHYFDPPPGLGTEPFLRSSGSILLAGAEDEGRRTLDRARRDATALGISVETLDREETLRRVPVLRDAPFDEALANPTDGVVDIRALLDAYLDAARRRGVRIRHGEPLTEIHRGGGRVEGVVTATGTIHSRCVVNAAGAWADEVARLAGARAVGLEPRRRHLYECDAPAEVDRTGPFVWHDGVDVYFRPDREGLLASPCDETPHPARDPDVDPEMEIVFRTKLERAFPRLRESPIRSTRVCLRTFAPDGQFVIGPDPELEGFLWVAALGGHGMSTSYGVGRLGADAIIGRESPELERFLPGRFAT